MGVDHGGVEVFVAEHVLNGPDIDAAFEHVGGEAVTEDVGFDVFGDSGFSGGFFQGALEDVGVEVVPPGDSGAGIAGEDIGGEDILPMPGPRGLGVFSLEGVGQFDRSVALGEVLIVKAFGVGDLGFEIGDENAGKDGDAILAAFTVTNGDLAARDIDVFDPESEGLNHTHSGSVHELAQKALNAVEAGEKVNDFAGGQDIG